MLTELEIRVRNLSLVVQDVEIDISNRELDDQQQKELHNVAESCRDVLSELENIVDNYRDLGTVANTKRSLAKHTWKRLKWEPSEIQDLR